MKKKTLLILAISLGLLVGVIAVFNINVTTRQGRNYKVATKKIPLYFKVLSFVYRHYAYKQLVSEIINNKINATDRTLAIFNWTHQNIRQNIPDNYPIVDDHVLNIIIRGYGANDQSAEVFATLCNYAEIDAFYTYLYTKQRNSKIVLAFAKLAEQWVAFDPYNGVYFVKNNHDLELATVEDITKGNWDVKYSASFNKKKIDYKKYFGSIADIKHNKWTRPGIQAPWPRLGYELKKPR